MGGRMDEHHAMQTVAWQLVYNYVKIQLGLYVKIQGWTVQEHLSGKTM